jgi:hypothetical protein
MNQFRIQYIYTQKCYSETPCIAILNKQKCLFSKVEDWKVKLVLSGGWYQWEGGGYKERVNEGNMVEIVCTHVFQEWGEGD